MVCRKTGKSNGEQQILIDVPIKKKIQDDEIRDEMKEVKTFLQEIVIKLEKK
ncbi:MAG TPA: hypothetical protein VMU30_11650 [Bacteroidota bacterium]|nr:hypothetical protein [Bacteroidota bacterium]